MASPTGAAAMYESRSLSRSSGLGGSGLTFLGLLAFLGAFFGAGAGFLLGAYDEMKTNHTGTSVFSFESLASLLLPSDARVLPARKALSPCPGRRPR